MPYCTKCEVELPKDGLYVSCQGCSGLLHFDCCTVAAATYRAMSKQRKNEWRCEFCRLANKIADILPEKFDLGAKFDNYLEKIDFASRFDDLFKEHLVEIKNKYTDITQKFEQLQDSVALIVADNKEKDSQIDSLIRKINNLEQRSLVDGMVIQGITEKNNEKLNSVVVSIAKKLEINIRDSDIRCINRLKESKSRVGGDTSRGPRPISVRFSHSSVRDLFLVKKNVQFKECDIFAGGSQNKIYINEMMSDYNRSLFWQAKSKVREVNWRYVWFAFGQIKVRKENGSRVIYINSATDLQKIV